MAPCAEHIPAPPTKAPFGKTLVIACGALAREILALRRQHGLSHIELRCLPALLHNSPHKIPDAVDSAIRSAKVEGFTDIFVAFADCGTGGRLDQVLQTHGVSRLPGPHCYAVFSGVKNFLENQERDMRCFFLTDFLARQFQALVFEPLGLDQHPELRDSYFGHYEKLVYLAQSQDSALDKLAEQAAQRLGLAYERRQTGFGALTTAIAAL